MRSFTIPCQSVIINNRIEGALFKFNFEKAVQKLLFREKVTDKDEKF